MHPKKFTILAQDKEHQYRDGLITFAEYVASLLGPVLQMRNDEVKKSEHSLKILKIESSD